MVFLRCYAELNDFLPPLRRQQESQLVLDETKAVAELIAEVGIPAAAVELVLVNGVSRGLDCPLRDGDRVSLYPMFEAFDVTPLLRLRSHPMRQVRFVADAHLGRLARYLRLLGFDTLFENDIGDSALARISAEKRRILLTRDRALLRRRLVNHGLWVPSTRPREQLAYVVGRLDLYALFRPFTRCTMCNGMLTPVPKATLEADLPPRVRAVFEDFWRCDDCGRVYWQGSHYDRLRVFVAQITPERAERT
ncbi:MAG: Mut7-C RNAse domain-containing protein [Pseudomonadota bacterium]|nr:Mut7-C RNAse domain-containing protein [Pseudomonadota bacterium]